MASIIKDNLKNNLENNLTQDIKNQNQIKEKLFIKTFGCQMNEYDSNQMINLLTEKKGMVITNEPDDADVILVNTCSVREKAQDKLYHQLGRWKKFKQKKTKFNYRSWRLCCLPRR